MYRLFARIPKGLDPVADAFRRHVEADGMALVREATEAAAAKAAAGVFLRNGKQKVVPTIARWQAMSVPCAGGRHGAGARGF